MSSAVIMCRKTVPGIAGPLSQETERADMTFTRTFEVAVAVDPVTLAYGRPWVQGLTVTEAITPRSTRATKRRLLPDIALAVRAETGSSLGHLGVGSLAGQVADAAAQYPAT